MQCYSIKFNLRFSDNLTICVSVPNPLTPTLSRIQVYTLYNYIYFVDNLHLCASGSSQAGYVILSEA